MGVIELGAPLLRQPDSPPFQRPNLEVGELLQLSESQWSEFLGKLNKNRLAWVDDLAERDAFDREQRHSSAKGDRNRQRQTGVGILIRWSAERLSPPSRTPFEFGSLLRPGEIPLDWLRALTAACHSEASNPARDNKHDWRSLWREF